MDFTNRWTFNHYTLHLLQRQRDILLLLMDGYASGKAGAHVRTSSSKFDVDTSLPSRYLCDEGLQNRGTVKPNSMKGADTLGARGHLPRGALWVHGEFWNDLPSLYPVSPCWVLSKSTSNFPQRTHEVKCEFFVKEPSDLLRTYLAGTSWGAF